MSFELRLEKEADHRQVETLTREAFWNLHIPGCGEHLLAHKLRVDPSFIPELDFVAVSDGRIAGNIMYTHAAVEDARGARRPVVLFGPLSVHPAYQGQGIGSALVRHSAEKARELGHTAILIYGSPKYYGRFGFRPAEDFGITNPEGRYHPALQALELVPGALAGAQGRFFEAEVYDTLTPEETEAFDKLFPPKEKRVTESQKAFERLASGGEG